jgi:hypothetical protein
VSEQAWAWLVIGPIVAPVVVLLLAELATIWWWEHCHVPERLRDGEVLRGIEAWVYRWLVDWKVRDE